jgi:hypothetical protein
MKRAIFALALVLIVFPALAQEVTMAGTWELYRVDTIGS